MNFDPINIFGNNNNNNNNNNNINNNNNNNGNGNNNNNDNNNSNTVAPVNTSRTDIDALSYNGPTVPHPRRRGMFDFGGFGLFGGLGLQQPQQQQPQQQQHQQQYQQESLSDPSSNNNSRNGNNNSNNNNSNNNNNNNNNNNIDVVKSEKVAVDDLLSNELLKLSLNDRTAIDEEIHGVTCLSPNESPEFLSRSLWAFQNEIDNANSNIPYEKKKIYHDILNRVSWRRRQQQQQQQQQQQLDINNNNNNNNNTTTTTNNNNIGQQQQQQQPQHQHQHQHQSINNNTNEKHYVINDINFRLRFLRCELFDIKKSVLRFFNYLNFINDLWGFDIVSQNIQIGIKDFTKSELKFFKRGLFQILPFRDRSGRRVIVIMGGMGSTNTLIARAKSYFYIWDVVTRDSIESQRKGAISITHQSAWTSGITTDNSSNAGDATDGSLSDSSVTTTTTTTTNNNYGGGGGGTSGKKKKNTKSNAGSFQVPHKELKMVNDLFASIPTRITANHNLYPDTSIYRFISKLIMVSVVSGSTQRLRQKFHFGDEIELRYQLQGFGIPINLIPSTETGTVKLHNFNSWMKTRQIVEENPNDNNQYTYNVKNTNKAQKNNNNNKNKNKIKGSSHNNNNNNIITTTTTTTTVQVTNIIVECPGTNDVIFRRGQSFKEHPGNDMFRDSILNYLTEKDYGNEVITASSSSSSSSSCIMTSTGSAAAAAAGSVDNNNTNNNNTNDTTATATATSTATSMMVCDDSTTTTTKDTNTNTNANNDNNKDRDELFCNWLLHKIQDSPRDGRFLEWDTDLNSWIQMFDSYKIKRKISVSLYNYEKRYSTSLRQQRQQKANATANSTSTATSTATSTSTIASAQQQQQQQQQHHQHQQASSSVTPVASVSTFAATNTFNFNNYYNNYNSDDGSGSGGGGTGTGTGGLNSMAYCFIEGGKPSSQKRNQSQNCCRVRFDNCGSNQHQHQHQHQNQQQQQRDGSNKKARTHSFDDSE